MPTLDQLRGSCPVPFLDESKFPGEGGYLLGRVCASVPGLAAGANCCLPCNGAYWLYPDNFYNLTRIPGYIAIASAILCSYMLVSFLILPAEKTRRHYLNTCLTLSILFLELGFVIPLLARPQQCYNEITPNGQTSSMICAWSGSFVVFGGAAINSWILIRALNMHLLICWNVKPGMRFFYCAQIFGWGLSAALLAACLTMTGVSFRFGDYCHVNHHMALQTLWGPLLGFAAVSVTMQLATFAYCLKVYLSNLRSGGGADAESVAVSSSAGSARAQSARAVYRRVSKVVQLQWRGLLIAVLGVVDMVYFSIVFVVLDNRTTNAVHDLNVILPWIACLIGSSGDKDKCLDLAEPISVNEATLIATLSLLSVVGVQAWLLLGNLRMVTAWASFFKREKNENYIAEDRQPLNSKKTYELLQVNTPSTAFSPDLANVRSPQIIYHSPLARIGATDYFNEERGRSYRSPVTSFSSPRAPLSVYLGTSEKEQSTNVTAKEADPPVSDDTDVQKPNQ